MSDDLERLAQAIRESDAPRLDAARRARMRSRVLSAEVTGAQFGHLRGVWGRVALAAAAVLFAALVLGSAAQASLPGDPAFFLKVEAERLGLLLKPDLYEHLDVTLQHADRRLDELEALSHRDASRLALAADAYTRTLADVRTALDAMAASAHSGRGRAIEETRAEIDRHVARLVELERSADGDVERALDRARELDDRIREVEAEGDDDDERAAPTASPTQRASETAKPDGGAGAPAATPPPARTAEPSRSPEPTDTAAPLGTGAPTRTPDPTRTADPTRTGDPTRTPDPTQTPDGAPTPDPSQTPERTRTPSPSPSRS